MLVAFPENCNHSQLRSMARVEDELLTHTENEATSLRRIIRVDSYWTRFNQDFIIETSKSRMMSGQTFPTLFISDLSSAWRSIWGRQNIEHLHLNQKKPCTSEHGCWKWWSHKNQNLLNHTYTYTWMVGEPPYFCKVAVFFRVLLVFDISV